MFPTISHYLHTVLFRHNSFLLYLRPPGYLPQILHRSHLRSLPSSKMGFQGVSWKAPCAQQRCSPCKSSSRSRKTVAKVTALLKPAEGYDVTWTQSVDEVNIKVPVNGSVRGKDIDLEVHPTRLSLRLNGTPILEGSLTDAGQINLAECFWNMDEEGGHKFAMITLGKKSSGYMSWEHLLVGDKVDLQATHRVFLQIKIGDKLLGKVVIDLFGNVVPRTVQNFITLCTGNKGQGSLGKPLHYKGCSFHRIIPGFMAQGGDFTAGNGTGGESIFGEKFPDENFKIKHDGPGYVAMANSGPNTNGSQFYILFQEQPHLNGKHVVFGKVSHGMDILHQMEKVGSASGQPNQPVVIEDCGELAVGDESQLSSILEENKLLMASLPAY